MTSEWRADPAQGITDRLAGDSLSYDLATYEELLERLLAEGYEFVGFDGALESGEVVLRHDVDLSVERAVEMAKLEASIGVSSTYCVLVTAPVYDVLAPETRRQLRCIVDAGHDLGLHFDPHHYWDREPSMAEVEARVIADRRALERVLDVDVDAVSIHIPPEWALDVDFAGFESTYKPAYFSEIGYVSDSNQKWRRSHPFDDGLPEALQLLVHPGLWHAEDRSIVDVMDDLRQRRVADVDDYLRSIGE